MKEKKIGFWKKNYKKDKQIKMKKQIKNDKDWSATQNHSYSPIHLSHESNFHERAWGGKKRVKWTLHNFTQNIIR